MLYQKDTVHGIKTILPLVLQVASEHRNPVLGMKLTDMLAEEQQTNPSADDTASTPREQTQTETPSTDHKHS